MRKRYIVELGMGADLHGGNVTEAAVRAIKDATSKSCLCGISDILGKDGRDMHVHVRLGCTRPDKLDKEAILAAVPLGSAELEIVEGGLEVRGLHVPTLGEGDKIVVVIAALTVSFDL